ncbi:MAG: phosphoenolpyruvate carboxykinase (ATP) [Melioribacteraceae bacterium]
MWQQLQNQGIHNINNLFYNLSTPALYEQGCRRREVMTAQHGPLVVRTEQHTGRSPNDKFIVRETFKRK